MKFTMLTTVTALALMTLASASLSSVARAADNAKGRNPAETATDLKRMQGAPSQVLTGEEAQRVMEEEAQRAMDEKAQRAMMDKAKANNMGATMESTPEAVTDLGEHVEYTLFGTEPNGVSTRIQANATAKGMIHQRVDNMMNERVGTLRDIIIDSKGEAQLAVVSDTRIPGIGKEAAFEYSMIMRQNANGDVVMPINEERIKAARSFSYDQSRAGEDANVRTIPAGGYSIDKLLSSRVIDPQGKNVASVENVTFRNGKADALIIGYDKTLGMGGRKAALRFSDVKLNSMGDGKAELQLTPTQATQLESLRQHRTLN